MGGLGFPDTVSVVYTDYLITPPTLHMEICVENDAPAPLDMATDQLLRIIVKPGMPCRQVPEYRLHLGEPPTPFH